MILVGDILRGNELFKQSHDYLYRALSKAEQLNDSLLCSVVYNRIAALGIDDQEIPLDTTERYARLSLELSRLQHNDTMIYNNLNILGVLETIRGNYQKSLDYLDDAYTLVRTTFPEDEPLILHNMARNWFSLGRSDHAVTMEKQAYEMAKKLNIPQYVRMSASYLKDYYISIGHYQEALHYVIQYYDAKEFILNQRVLVQLKEFNNQMEAEKQHLENQRLVYEKKLTDGQLRLFMIGGILLLVLLIVTVGFIIYQNRQRKKIREIAIRLDQSNAVLTRFISILGHDLRSPFNALIGYTDLLKNDASMIEMEREEIIARLYLVTRSTFRLLERILEWSHLQSGSVKPMLKTCDLSEMVRETIQVLDPSAFHKNIMIVFNHPGPIEIFTDENMILTVIRNLISNAIKFSHPGGRIEIGATSQENPVSFFIRDHGVGISKENLERLFQLDNKFKSQGTTGESGTGLGLILCHDYLAMLGGNLEVSSEEGKGSTFTVTLP